MDSKKFRSLLKREENFVVREVLKKSFFLKYERGKNGMRRVQGPYTVFILRKKGLTTEKAIEIISQKYGIPTKTIGYAGLKDKFAVTYQHITIKGNFKGFQRENMSLSVLGKTNRHISIGDIDGNRFEITLTKNKNICSKVMKINCIPNYFGFQRFGISKKNVSIGRRLLRREYSAAVKKINGLYRKTFLCIRAVEKNKLKFFVHSYQSYLFNEVLKKYRKKNKKPFSRDIKIPGAKTVLGKGLFDVMIKEILRKDRINTEDFAFQDLGFMCSGSQRPAFVKIGKLDCEENSGTKICFFLPPGSYATAVLQEVGL